MRRTIPILIASVALLQSSLVSAQSVATDPVGFITLNVNAPASTGGSAITLLGVGFTQPVSYQATLSSASGTALTDSNATWADNAYNGANGNFYVELTTGTGAGRTSQITATSGTNKTITTAEDLSSLVTAGTGYKIRPNWTLATFFGTGASLVITGGTSTTADEVLIYDPANNPPAYDVYYYKNAGITGGNGWRRAQPNGSLSTDVSTTPISSTAGIIVRRHTAGALSFPLAGAVKLGQTEYVVKPGTNLLSNVYPSGTITLASSGLYTDGSTSGLAGGTSTTADQVLIYDTTNNPPAYDVYYYKTAGITGGTGWRKAQPNGSLSADASGTVIPTGASIIIQRVVNSNTVWTTAQPF